MWTIVSIAISVIAALIALHAELRATRSDRELDAVLTLIATRNTDGSITVRIRNVGTRTIRRASIDFGELRGIEVLTVEVTENVTLEPMESLELVVGESDADDVPELLTVYFERRTAGIRTRHHKNVGTDDWTGLLRAQPQE